MRRVLARLVEALARLGDPTVTRFANDTDDPPAPWDDYGYRAPTPPNPNQERA